MDDRIEAVDHQLDRCRHRTLVEARVSNTQYQYTLVDVDIDELDHWAPILFNKAQNVAAAD
jgi:hypothetical protein